MAALHLVGPLLEALPKGQQRLLQQRTTTVSTWSSGAGVGQNFVGSGTAPGRPWKGCFLGGVWLARVLTCGGTTRSRTRSQLGTGNSLTRSQDGYQNREDSRGPGLLAYYPGGPRTPALAAPISWLARPTSGKLISGKSDSEAQRHNASGSSAVGAAVLPANPNARHRGRTAGKDESPGGLDGAYTIAGRVHHEHYCKDGCLQHAQARSPVHAYAHLDTCPEGFGCGGLYPKDRGGGRECGVGTLRGPRIKSSYHKKQGNLINEVMGEGILFDGVACAFNEFVAGTFRTMHVGDRILSITGLNEPSLVPSELRRGAVFRYIYT